MSLVVNLVGGPPWGFRVAQKIGESPVVSQVLPESQAFMEGIRTGDFITAVNGEDCENAHQVRFKMCNSHGMLRLKLKRNEGNASFLPNQDDQISRSSTPSTFCSGIGKAMNTAAKPPMLSSYNGGMRGSAQEKKHFFEKAIACQVTQIPAAVKYERRKPSILDGRKESKTNAFDCDSMSGDFIEMQSNADQHRTVTNNVENVATMSDHTNGLMDSMDRDLMLRASSSTPIARGSPARDPLPSLATWESQTNTPNDEQSYFFSTTGQGMCDTSTDSGIPSTTASISTPPCPPPSSTPVPFQTGKKWGIRMDDEAKCAAPITSAVTTGGASGEVEVPRPQSVAELRAQIATKLEVRNPAGQKAAPVAPSTVPVIIHQPALAHYGKLTPSASLLSLNRIEQGLDSGDAACIAPPSSSTVRTIHCEYSPTPSAPSFIGYDRGQSPVSINETASDCGAGMYSTMSTLKRHNSQLSLAPEVQRAVLFDPGADQMEHSDFKTELYAAGDGFRPQLRKPAYNNFHTFQEPHPLPTNVNANQDNFVQLVNSSTLPQANIFEASVSHGPTTHSTVDPNPVVSEPDRLKALIEVASNAFRGDQGCQLGKNLYKWSSTDALVTNNEPPPRSTPLPSFENATEPSRTETINGYVTLPARGSAGKSSVRRRRGSTDAEFSTWYKEMYKQIHEQKPTWENARERLHSVVDDSSSHTMTDIPSVTLQSKLKESTDLQHQQRAMSTGRYDPVADMEILDRWANHKQVLRASRQNELTSKPKTAMDALRFACSSVGTDALPSVTKSRSVKRSFTQHFHLPSYRLTNDDRRVLWSSSCCCNRCSKHRAEVEQMMERNAVKKELQRDRLGECVKRHYIKSRLEETAKDLQTVIDQLDAFSKMRSKSNPEITCKLRSSGAKFSYLFGENPSTSSGGLENDQFSDALVKGPHETKKPTMEDILQRQRAEKLCEELDDQRNRRHGYFPGASPLLQNNVQRFDHLLHDQVSQADSSSRSFLNGYTVGRREAQAPVLTCTALYQFSAKNSRELSLNRGDVVRVHREIDANWLEGERNGHVGIFPASYVQMDEDPSTSRNKVRALYPFQARNRNELSLKKGELLRRRRSIDSNWLEGTNAKGQIGIFPRIYVEEYVEGVENSNTHLLNGIPDRPKTPKMTSEDCFSRVKSPYAVKKEVDRSHQILQWEKRQDSAGYSGSAKVVPKNSETYRAIYPYKPGQADELELQENDIVFVVEKCDDGWYIGTLLRTGQFGTFPGNYVEKH